MTESPTIASPAAPPKATRLRRSSVYRSAAGRLALLDFVAHTRASLPFATRCTDVPTRFGPVHVTAGGAENGPTLVVIPGLSIAGPVMLDFLAPLARTFNLVALDIIGMPGQSADRPLPPRAHAHGLMLSDALDGLGLARADLVAASFGAAMALDLAAMTPARVGRMALIVPAGLTPHLPFARIGALYAGFFAYRALPHRALLQPVARPLGRAYSALQLDYLDLVIRHTRFARHRPAGPFSKAELAGLETPPLIIQADQDRMFPFAPTRAHAQKALPGARFETLQNSGHTPEPSAMAAMVGTIEEYFVS